MVGSISLFNRSIVACPRGSCQIWWPPECHTVHFAGGCQKIWDLKRPQVTVGVSTLLILSLLCYIQKPTMIHFPNEILFIIINELSADEKDSLAVWLASCHLVSHMFCLIATPLLFSCVHLKEDKASYHDTGSYNHEAPIPLLHAVKLNQILVNNNQIATSIHTLVLEYHTDHHGLVGGGIITSILTRLPYIQNFTWEVLKPFYPLEFSAILKDLSLAIQALFCSPYLTKLELCNISDVPLVLITTCTNLKNLRLSRIQFSVTFPLFLFEISATIEFYMQNNVHNTPDVQPDSHLKSLEIN